MEDIDNRSNNSDLVLFRVDEEYFGFPMIKLLEIIAYTKLIPLPGMPSCVPGVQILRKKTHVIFDMRLVLGKEPKEYTGHTPILILELCSSDMDYCYNHKKCNKTDCPAYKSTEKRCWLISETHCRDEIQGSFYHKLDACKKCSFYKDVYRDNIKKVGIIVDEIIGTQHKISSEQEISKDAKDSLVQGFVTDNDKVISIIDIDRLADF